MEAYEFDELKSNLRDYLESHSIDTSRMFRCINPLHTDSNASMKYFDDNKAYCFGCGATFNLLDAISVMENVDKKEAFKRAVNYYKRHTTKPTGIVKPKEKTLKEYSLKDYNKAFTYWHNNLLTNKEAQSYLKSRGISIETAKKFNLGFNEFHFKDVCLKALVIPINQNCFSARNIDITNKEFRYYKPKGARIDIFNKEALTNKQPYCVITEGEFDCLSFETIGINAIALGGVNNIGKFTQLEKDTTKTYILSLDNDEAGNLAENQLIEYFDRNKIKYEIYKNMGYKDANKALVESKKLFEIGINNITQRIINNNLKKQEVM